MQIVTFPLLLARRLTRTTSTERALSTMVRLCFWGICISTCALAVVAAVMRGFEQVTHQSIQGIHADLIIRSSQPLDYEKIKNVIRSEFTDTILEISPSSTHHVVINHTDRDDFTIAVITAIDPKTAEAVNALHQRILTPMGVPLETVMSDDKIIIGKLLAQELQLKVGDKISLLYPEEKQTKRNRLTFDSVDAHVGGIFATGIDEFDMGGIFASHAFTTEHLNTPETITQINIKLQPKSDATTVQKKLQARLQLPVISWKELYPPLMAALVLEKYAMIFILSLIVLIASMNTISLLFMFITHKRQMIALLYAQGMSRRAIMSTFIAFGVGLTTLAAATGLAAAVAISYLLETYRLIPLPDVYYATHLPAHMNATIVISVLVLVIIIGFISAWYPTRSMNRKKIAQVLKFDM